MPTAEIISLIVNFVLGSGLAGVLIFYQSKKRTANAEATTAEVRKFSRGYPRGQARPHVLLVDFRHRHLNHHLHNLPHFEIKLAEKLH